MERPDRSPIALRRIRQLGIAERFGLTDADHRMELRVPLSDLAQVRLDNLHGGESPIADERRQLSSGAINQRSICHGDLLCRRPRAGSRHESFNIQVK
jgi:hypothetical protein